MAYLFVILPQISLVISSDQEIRFSDCCYFFSGTAMLNLMQDYHF